MSNKMKLQRLTFALQPLSREETRLTLERAQAFWRGKTPVPSAKWNSLRAAEHARAFTTAGLMQAGFLADMHSAMNKVVLEGGKLSDFRTRFREIANQSGWDYYGGEDWRTSLIYRQNLRTAWNAGMFVRAMENKDTLPYMKRIIGRSLEHRPDHVREANRQVVYPVTSSYWNVNMPPYWRGEVAFNCACSVVTMSAAEAASYVRLDPETDGEIVNPGRIEWAENYEQTLQQQVAAYPQGLRATVSSWLKSAFSAARGAFAGWLK